jgi:hypothetical protein
MLGNTGISSLGIMQAAAAAAARVCNDARPCFACVLEEFGKETAPQRDAELERHFKLFSVLLTQYINSFGAALLFARGVAMSVLPGQSRTHAAQAIEKYAAEDVADLLRGFALFFVLFKVDAPIEIKESWWSLTRQLADWMVKRAYVRQDFRLSLEPCDDDVKINAVCGAGLINQQAEQIASSIFEPDDERHGEPIYLVSRVTPGKLWFLYSSSLEKCAEFGPVIVPPAVANFIKPGWGLDCKFVRVAGRWYITGVEDVLPI